MPLRFARTAPVVTSLLVGGALVLAAGCGSEDRPSAPLTPIEETGADTGLPIFESGTDGASDDASTEDGSTPDGTSGDGTVPDGSGVDGTVADTSMAGDATGTDTRVVADSGVVLSDAPFVKDTSVGEVFVLDSASGDASPTNVPVGQACTNSAQCDPNGGSVGVCSNSVGANAIDPAPACFATSCDNGSTDVGKACGLGGAGLCVGGGPDGVCRPKCTFGAAGAAPTGCVGKTGCNAVSWSRAGATVTGVGICHGGCTLDADCGGQVCQVETGECVVTKQTFTKTLGQACTATSECDCEGSTATGICTRFCRVGDATTACGAGFRCDPGLPSSDGTGALFTSSPAGMVGKCHKECNNAADCSAFGGVCEANNSTGAKICRVP